MTISHGHYSAEAEFALTPRSSIIAIILEIMIWTIKSLPADGAFYALIGVVLGPMYPVVMMVIVDVLPGELQAGSIGWIASLGQAGSAMMPL